MEFIYKAKVGAIITSPSDLYIVQRVLGSGVYGDVNLCRKVYSNQTVALKVLKDPHHIALGMEEKEILKKLRDHGSEHFNIVRWIDSFHFMGHYCHEFETLDISLFEFVKRCPFQSLQLKAIRPIVHQMAGALVFLKRVGIIHCDLKLDNIMMVAHLAQPLRIKLIDFGVACSVSQVRQGCIVQALWYRAPEVLVGARYDEAIDIWSVGCIVAEIFLGNALFRTRDQYDMMTHIVQMVGQPPKDLLDAGLNTKKYFRLTDGYTDWKLLDLLEPPTQCIVRKLDHIYKYDPFSRLTGHDEAHAFDRLFFIDLLKQMLDANPATRITPKGILGHPFITMSHFYGCADHNYSHECQNIMTQVLDLHMTEEQPTTSNSSAKTNLAPKMPLATQSPPSPPKNTRDADNKQGQDSCKRKQKRQRENDNTSRKKKRKTNNQGHSAEDPVIIKDTPVSHKRQRDNDDSSPAKKRRASDPERSAEETPDLIIVGSPVNRKRQRQEEDCVLVIDLTSPPKQRRLY